MISRNRSVQISLCVFVAILALQGVSGGVESFQARVNCSISLVVSFTILIELH